MYSTREESFIETVTFKLDLKTQIIHQLDDAPENGSKGELRGRKQAFQKERKS